MKNVGFAPILLFTYKRLDVLKRTVTALQQNVHADESNLFIFSDAAKVPDEEPLVSKVREFIKTINGFKRIHIFEANLNMGLANSIISGVTQVINEYGKVIVLEDDLITSSNFLLYMNQALEFYQNNSKVFSIAGHTISISVSADYAYDIYFLQRASSWGWASWKERWSEIDWDVNDFNQFKKNRKAKKEFKLGGSDLFNMLNKQMQGKIDSWAIRWCYHQFKQKSYTAYPILSKVKNIGFGKGATHTNVYNRYNSELDNELKWEFNFPKNIVSDANFAKQFQNYYSIKSRIKGRLMTGMIKFGLIKIKKNEL